MPFIIIIIIIIIIKSTASNTVERFSKSFNGNILRISCFKKHFCIFQRASK